MHVLSTVLSFLVVKEAHGGIDILYNNICHAKSCSVAVFGMGQSHDQCVSFLTIYTTLRDIGRLTSNIVWLIMKNMTLGISVGH